MNNIETLKKIDIKQLISKETTLKFKGNTLEKCPFCGSGTGKNKSSALNVNPQTNTFKCFHCDKKGNPIEFIRYYKDLPNGSALKYLQENYSSLPAYEAPKNEKNTSLKSQIYAISRNKIKPAS